MGDDSEPLEYATPATNGEASRSNWPVGIYVAALLWAAMSMLYYTAITTAYADEAGAHSRTQFALLACAGARLVWARHRAERNRGWVFYVAILFFAPAIWAIVANPIATVSRRVLGGPLLP
jgi:hypothetical protein